MKHKQRAQFERRLWSEFEHSAQLALTDAVPKQPGTCAVPIAPAEFLGLTDSMLSTSIPDT